MQTTLDSTGVPEKISSTVHSTVDATKQVGGVIYSTGKLGVDKISENENVSHALERSKTTISTVGESVGSVSTSMYKRFRTLLVEDTGDEERKEEEKENKAIIHGIFEEPRVAGQNNQ